MFADAFNYFVYGGKQVVDPEQLRPVDTTELIVPYGEDDTGITIQPIQKIRDAFLAIQTDGNAVFMLLGIENQASVHYAMPVKSLLYDVIEDGAQVQEAERAYCKEKNHGDSKAEFLSGFYKTDCLVPVVTLVIYWGAGAWDGPMSLHDMMNTDNAEILAYVPDYKLNLITANQMTDAEMDKFRSELGLSLMYVKNSLDATAMSQMMADDRYRTVSKETAILLNGLLKINVPIIEGKEEYDMCKAVETMLDTAKIETTIRMLKKAMDKNKWTLEEAMNFFELPMSEKDVYAAAMA